MELTDAERECRNDAADYERARWHVHQDRAIDGNNEVAAIDYAEESDDGPFVSVWTGKGWNATEAWQVDEFIDALTTAREHVFGERKES